MSERPCGQGPPGREVGDTPARCDGVQPSGRAALAAWRRGGVGGLGGNTSWRVARELRQPYPVALVVHLLSPPARDASGWGIRVAAATPPHLLPLHATSPTVACALATTGHGAPPGGGAHLGDAVSLTTISTAAGVVGCRCFSNLHHWYGPEGGGGR